MLRPCIICYKSYCCGDEHVDVNQGSEGLIHFFKLLERHLDDDIHHPGGNGSSESKQLPFEQLIQAGMLTCKDCSKLVDSFCELYDKMKSVELQLSYKLRTLTDTMSYAGNVPTRIKNFRESINQLQIEDVSASSILDSKKDLVKKCAHKLRKAFPKLVITKHNSFSVSSQAEKSSLVYLNEESDSSSISTGENSKRLKLHYNRRDITATTSTESLKISQVAKSWEQGSHEKGLKSVVVKKEPNDSESESYHHDEADEDYNCPEVNDNDDNSEATEQPSGEHIPAFLSSSSNTARKWTTEQGQKRTREATRRDPETGKYRCFECPKEFSHSSGRSIHFKIVHSKLRYKCNECLKKFPTRPDYYRHYEQVHLGIPQFQCSLCKKSFTSRNNWKTHQRTSVCSRSRDPGSIVAKEPEEEPGENI